MDVEHQKLDASRIDLDGFDVEAWLKQAEAEAARLPGEFALQHVTKLCGFVRHCLAEGRDDDAKLALVKIRDMFNAVAAEQKHRDAIKHIATLAGGSEGGKKGGGRNRKVDPEAVKQKRDELLADGTGKRDVVSKLAARFGVTAPTIRNALKQ